MAEKSETSHSRLLTELLDSEREAASMTDITLVCEGKNFPAHKIILSATSNYFRTMFSPGADESKSTIIELPSVGAEEMEIILPFMYTGKFKDVDDHRLLEALLETSYFLHVNALFECCYQKLSEKLSCNCFLKTCNLAFHYNDKGMTTHVITFLAQRFEDVAKSEEFLKLNACQMQKIAHHPETLKFSMDVVISGIFRWMEVEKVREKTVLQIINALELQRMSTAFLSETLGKQSLVQKEFHILTLLTSVATSRTLTLSSSKLENNKEPTIFAFGKNDHHQVFMVYNIMKDQWSLPKILPFHLENNMTVVYFGGHVYVLGGGESSNARPSAKVIKYCLVTNTIVSFGTLTVPVSHVGAGVLDGYIYVVNGVDEEGEDVSTVQRYDPVAGTCQTIAQPNNRHSVPYVLPFGKYLLVLGHYKGENSIERYDPTSDTWILVTVFHGEVARCRAAICQHKLFVAPTQGTAEFKVYDFSSNKWEQQQFDGSPATIFGLYAASVEGKCIFLVCDGEGEFYALDPDSKQWITKSSSNGRTWNAWQTCIV